MRLGLSLAGVAAAALLSCPPSRGQDKDAAALKRENDLLKRENDLLKRENDLLKLELAQLKKGGGAAGAGSDPTTPISATANDVVYVYKGMTRTGTDLFVTLVATSNTGEKPSPAGVMTLIDGDGNKYVGMPQGGFGALPVLREGVPLKMVWKFGPNALTKQGSAPSAKITSFASMTVDADVGGARTAVEFRNVPATLPAPKKK